jgi:protein involved in polysaccharide export with SLBB domain
MKRIISIFLMVSMLFPVLSSAVLAFEYTLAPDDLLEVKILNQKDMDTKQAVAPDGSISLPFLGRVQAQGKTLSEFQTYLTTELAKYVDKPQLVIYFAPRSIYVIQHNLKTNISEVKEAKTIAEAKAYAGADYTKEIKYGDVISVDVGIQSDWWESNWYKVLTGIAVAVGVYETLKK